MRVEFPENLPLLLTPEEAAEQLGVGRTTVYELMATSQVESVKIGRSRRIPREALVEYVLSLRQARGAL